MSFRLSIRSKILFSFVLLVGLVSAIFTLTSYFRIINTMHSETKKHGVAVIKTFSHLAAPLIFESDYVTIMDNADMLIKNSDIMLITITDLHGQVWLTTSTAQTARFVSDPFYEDILKSNTIGHRDVSLNGQKRIEFVSPITALGKVLYLVKMEISLEGIEKQAAKRIQEAILICIAMIISASLVGIFLSKLLTDSLEKLVRGTNEIARGNFAYRINVTSSDEIGILSESFNLMTDKLEKELSERKHAEEKLREHRNRLEELVLERTAQLTQTNQRLTEEIDERKQVEDTLKKSEARYRNLFQSSSDGLVVHDLEGNIFDVNQMFLKQSGFTREEILKLKIMDLHPSNMLEKSGQAFREISTNGYINFEVTFKKKSGELFPAEVSANLLDIGDQKVIQGMVRDISDRKIREEELLKIQKLESTGILAGGIAHDFNNLLTAILGNISMAKMFATADDKVFKRLTDAEKASIRAKDLTQQLLTFSKGGAPIKTVTSISELINDSTSFTLSGSNVTYELFAADNLWPVNIDEGQISQVIQNVVKNAEHSMPDGGKVIIQAENITLDVQEALPLKKGKYVKVTVVDQGVGIPNKLIPKIFDPYYSTKQEGSGLGLAVAYSIIKNHDGLITAESELERGTTFHIYLPASEKPLPVKIEAQGKSLRSCEKILIMDDEEVILNVATDMLNVMGFRTEVAPDGVEAVSIYRKAMQDGQPFDGVVLDLTIPGGMGGLETVKQLLEIDPDVKAIVSSGYANDPVMADFESYGFRGVVSKPYDIKKLGEALHKLFT